MAPPLLSEVKTKTTIDMMSVKVIMHVASFITFDRDIRKKMRQVIGQVAIFKFKNSLSRRHAQKGQIHSISLSFQKKVSVLTKFSRLSAFTVQLVHTKKSLNQAYLSQSLKTSDSSNPDTRRLIKTYEGKNRCR